MAAAPQPDETTVTLLLDEARELLGDESRRGESLNQRGAAVSGFVGVVIALAGTVETTTFGSGGEYHAVAAALAGAALAALLACVGLIGWGVLLPSAGISISLADVKKFPTYAFITRSPMMTTGYILQGTVGILERERDRNNDKARFLRYGYIAMGVGLLLVSAAGITLTVEAVTRA